MIRNGATPVETPVGTFHMGLTSSNEYELDVYAETESGEVTINGVTYDGTIYYRSRAYTIASGELIRFNSHYWDTTHCNRWDASKVRHVPMSDAARRKLAEYLTPAAESMLSDDARTTAYRVRSAESSRGYALADANRDIDKANELAARIRELGGECPDVARFEVTR